MRSTLWAGTCTLRAIFALGTPQGATLGAIGGKKMGFRYPTPPFPVPPSTPPKRALVRTLKNSAHFVVFRFNLSDEGILLTRDRSCSSDGFRARVRVGRSSKKEGTHRANPCYRQTAYVPRVARAQPLP